VQVTGAVVAMQAASHDQPHATSGIAAHPCEKRKDGAATFHYGKGRTERGKGGPAPQFKDNWDKRIEAHRPPPQKRDDNLQFLQNLNNLMMGMVPITEPFVRDITGKLHQDIPDHVPDNWTREDMELARDELQQRFATKNYNQDRAEELTKRFVADPRSSLAGVLMSDLLAEFHRGYPLENLLLLLLNDNTELVKAGAWIASELGEKGKPLLNDVSPLLQHPDSKVRFSTIDCILLWADPSKGPELASVVKLIEDPESRVRWKVMDFLSRATREQLSAALSYLEATDPQSKNIPGLRLLLGSGADNPREATVALQGQDGLMRKYGVVLARRVAEIDRDPLLYAASIDDPDVKDFADTSISLL